MFHTITRRLGKGLTVMGGVLLSSTIMIAPHVASAGEIQFWTQPYGDLIKWKGEIQQIADAFEAETGTKVNYEPLNWSVAYNTWLTVAQGGAAPDCADMYWLHSFSGIGGDKYGPMPINEFASTWPNLEKDFFTGSLQDVNWRGDFYGIPWRGDIRAMLYRTDAAEAAGMTGSPQTWDELVEFAKAMTERDDSGNVTRWGLALGPKASTQGYIPFYWQAGGEFMSEDGKTATIDNDASRKALTLLREMVWKHKVLSPDFMEKEHDAEADFISGNVALVASAPGPWAPKLERDYPELNGKWSLALPAAGENGRQAYSGGGYFGLLRGTEKAAECVSWISYLSQPENMQKLSEASGNVSPSRAVMASDFWNDSDWKKVVSETLDHGHTSQHPSPVWNALIKPEPGAVIYDMMYEAVVQQKDLDETIARAQTRMQAEMDRAQ